MKTGKKLFLLFFVLFLLPTASCSRNLYSGAVFQNIHSDQEREKLYAFFDSGVEKTVISDNLTSRDIIETARQYIGVPHCMRGTTTRCMDCSGLVLSVFRAHGIHLPHNSEDQARYGSIVNSRESLSEGDLVFFVRTYRTSKLITHSGIYVGNNKFIHSSTRRGVIITSMDDPYWSERFIFGTRLI